MKSLIYLLVAVGGFIGAYIPVWLFEVNELSVSSILGGIIGGILGIWFAVKISS